MSRFIRTSIDPEQAREYIRKNIPVYVKDEHGNILKAHAITPSYSAVVETVSGAVDLIYSHAFYIEVLV